MGVEPYSRAAHDQMVASWCAKRGVPATILSIMPAHGFIVADVAAGFLYRTDSSIALIEGLISNPESEPGARDLAIDAIFEALFDLARRLGFAMVWGFSARPEIEERARRLGFHVDDKRTYRFGAYRL